MTTDRGALHNGLQLVGEIYHYQFVLNGRVFRGSTGCFVFDDAKRWLRRYKGKLELEGVGIREIPTLKKLLAEWEKVAATTNDAGQISSMKAQIGKHFKALLPLQIDQITTEKVQGALLEYLQGTGDGPGRQGHSPGGANALLRRLGILMGWAVRCDYILKKPYSVKRFKPQQTPRPVVRSDKAEAFIEALQKCSYSKDRRLAVGLQFALGIRESEALGARWEFFDLERRVLVVGRIEEERFKTKGGEARQLPLPDWLHGWLLAHWEKAGRPKEGLLMPSELSAEVPHSPGYTRALVRRVGESISLPGLSPHRLRASFISSLALEAGVPIPQIQQIVGHRHLETTMRYVEGAEKHENVLAALSDLRNISSQTVLKSVESYKPKASKKSKKAS